MFSVFACCHGTTVAKVEDSTKCDKISSKKNHLGCPRCSGMTNILTLHCKHRCCVRCYNKDRICKQCEKAKQRCRFSLC